MELVNKEVYKKIKSADIEAIILGGGYGKGEGGVYRIKDKEYLFNDYDFFIIVKNISKKKKKKYQKILIDISEKLTSGIGIDVDFGPLKSIKEIKNMSFTQMWGELKFGHKVISGKNNIMDFYPYNNLNNIPETEVLKMLLNRGVGLLLAEERLKKSNLNREDIDFISRNIYKSGLCMGDSILIMENTFHHLYRKRLELLNQIKNQKMIKKYNIRNIYKESLEFKLQPDHTLTKDKLIKLHKFYKETFMDIYFNLFNRFFNKFHKKNISETCEEILKINLSSNILKNILLNIRDFRLNCISIRYFIKYPRVRLFYVLPYLLYPDLTQSEPKTYCRNSAYLNVKSCQKKHEYGIEDPNLTQSESNRHCRYNFKNINKILGLNISASKKNIKDRFLFLWERYN
jgi:hypothetical protein